MIKQLFPWLDGSFKAKVPSLLTYMSLLSWCIALYFAWVGNIYIWWEHLAAYFLLLSLILDYADGRVARKRWVASEYGMVLDSLVDFFVFWGVSVLIARQKFWIEAGIVISWFLFLVSWAHRLARFTANKADQGKTKEYHGLPITLNGIGIPILLLTWATAPRRISYFLAMAILMSSDLSVKKI